MSPCRDCGRARRRHNTHIHLCGYCARTSDDTGLTGGAWVRHGLTLRWEATS